MNTCCIAYAAAWLVVFIALQALIIILSQGHVSKQFSLRSGYGAFEVISIVCICKSLQFNNLIKILDWEMKHYY